MGINVNLPVLLTKAANTLNTVSTLSAFLGPDAKIVVEGVKVVAKVIGAAQFGVEGYNNLATELDALDKRMTTVLKRGVKASDFKAEVAAIKETDKKIDAILATLKAKRK
jgi:glucuronate isomerase